MHKKTKLVVMMVGMLMLAVCAEAKAAFPVNFKVCNNLAPSNDGIVTINNMEYSLYSRVQPSACVTLSTYNCTQTSDNDRLCDITNYQRQIAIIDITSQGNMVIKHANARPYLGCVYQMDNSTLTLESANNYQCTGAVVPLPH
jgi:zona occludens toxin (predicted ATPase)